MKISECDVRKAEVLEYELMKNYCFVRKFVITKTELNRKIPAYRIGGRGGALFCGAFHGMERITAHMLYVFLGEVCSRFVSDSVFAEKLSVKGLTVVPMVNPDGVEISVNGIHTAGKNAEFVSECLIKSRVSHKKWQANGRGIDINHNFNAGFSAVKENERSLGITAPAPTRYGGEYPESERESKALCELCRQENFQMAVALHTQGREIYYDFGGNTPRKSVQLAENMAKLSGYVVSHPSGIAVGGGFKDWFIEEFHRPAFTLEIGEGENPLSPEIFDIEYPKVSKMLWYLLEYIIYEQ
ncbi:MAG: M14 family metallocarboxypeptidase [Ruminococcus sp.]|nr:M14 family metallocarboxypeptidase [Ruminococcus sp.]